MGPIVPILIICGVIALIVVIAVFAHLAEKKRTEDLRLQAGRLGLTTFQEEAPAPLAGFHHFPLFNRGHSKRIRNLMEGSVDEIRVAVFDYHFTVGGGKSQTVHHQTVCAVCDRRLRLPVFDLKPESIWNKLGALFGYEDIDFEEHPEFSRKYFLSGVGEAAVRALFRPEVRDNLEKRDGLSLEGAGDRFICFRTNVRVEPGKIESLTRETLETLVLFRPEEEASKPLAG
jgi:hypothetical protein